MGLGYSSRGRQVSHSQLVRVALHAAPQPRRRFIVHAHGRFLLRPETPSGGSLVSHIQIVSNTEVSLNTL